MTRRSSTSSCASRRSPSNARTSAGSTAPPRRHLRASVEEIFTVVETKKSLVAVMKDGALHKNRLITR